VISVIYGFLNPVVSGNGDFGRLAGGLGDANDQAAVLVAAIPIATSLAFAWRNRPALRNAALLGAVMCLAGVVNTLSRGGLVALAVVLLAAVVFSGRWRPWATALLLIVTVGTAVYFIAIASNNQRARVTSTTTSGRDDIWRIARRMISARPVTGFGSGNFQVSAIHYVNQAGPISNANLIVDVPHVAHNIYLELLADLGVPGLLAFLGIVASCMGAAGRAALDFRRSGDRDLELISRCVLLSLVGFMTADFFLSGEFSKQLWLMLALCPALLLLARSKLADATG
jgi:O-antigen ligase